MAVAASRQQLRRLLDFRLALGILAFLVIAAPWYVWVGLETKGLWLLGFWRTHNQNRFLAAMENHGGSPFYYLLCTPLYLMFSRWFTADGIIQALRIVSLFSGLGLIEIAYRAVRGAFPMRPDLQIAGTLVGGLLPINVYMCQYVGNEPLAGLPIVVYYTGLSQPGVGCPGVPGGECAVALGPILSLHLVFHVLTGGNAHIVTKPFFHFPSPAGRDGPRHCEPRHPSPRESDRHGHPPA